LILDDSSVCLGYNNIFDMLAKDFLSDANKQPMYQMSHDRAFPVIAGVGVSQQIPDFVGTKRN